VGAYDALLTAVLCVTGLQCFIADFDRSALLSFYECVYTAVGHQLV